MTLSTAPSTEPQLFFGPKDLPRLRRLYGEQTSLAGVRQRVEAVDRVALRRFLASEVDYHDQVGDINRVGDVAMEMAFHHLMTGDEDAAALAREAMRALMRFASWDFFREEGDQVVGVQRAPSSTIAVACVVDWLGDAVDAAERRVWLAAMGERGCAPCYLGLRHIRWPRQCRGWSFAPDSAIAKQRSDCPTESARRPEITQTTNLRAAPAGGLAIGVAALRRWGEVPTEFDSWLEMATHSLAVFKDIYLPDGSHHEGVHYGNYTSESIFCAIVALQRMELGDLRSMVDWPAHVRFMLNLAMPTTQNPHDVINISDNGWHRDPALFLHPAGRPESRSALPFWVAREHRDGLAQWFGQNLAAEHSLWSLIFFDETVDPVPPDQGGRTWFPEVDWVVARTGWRAEDLVVCLRSGIGANHEHADRNSLIVKYGGEALIVDPMRPPYGYSDPAWLMRTTAGHSAILVNGEGHFYHNGVEGTPGTIAQARIVDRGAGEGWSWWTSDATQAYRLVQRDIRSVVRLVLVAFDLPAVVVVDRVMQWNQPATVEARFFADDWDRAVEITVDEQGFGLRRPGASAVARVFSRTAFTVRSDRLPIPPERAQKHPFVAVTVEPTQATTLLTVIGLAAGDAAPPPVAVEEDEAGFMVVLGAGPQRRDFRIVEGDRCPRIET